MLKKYILTPCGNKGLILGYISSVAYVQYNESAVLVAWWYFSGLPRWCFGFKPPLFLVLSNKLLVNLLFFEEVIFFIFNCYKSTHSR